MAVAVLKIMRLPLLAPPSMRYSSTRYCARWQLMSSAHATSSGIDSQRDPALALSAGSLSPTFRKRAAMRSMFFLPFSQLSLAPPARRPIGGLGAAGDLPIGMADSGS